MALAGQAKISGDLNQYDEMSRLCFQTLTELKGYPPNQAEACAQIQLSWNYFYLGEYSTALEWGMRALETARVCRSRIREASALDVVASIYSVMSDHPQALACHAEALRVVDESGDEQEKTVILNNAALSLMSAGKLREALETGLRGLEQACQLGMTPFISNYHDTAAQIYLALGNVESAESTLRTGLSFSTAKRPDYLLAAHTKDLGRVCLALGKFGEAAGLLHAAIEDFEHLGVRGELALCYQLLSQLYEQQGNFSLALEQYKIYDAQREATIGKDVARRIDALKANYDLQLAQRDAEIERLRNVELQSEIEERKRIQVVLEQMATVDALTNLNNRGQFFILAEREVERSLRYVHPLAGLMIDIDAFKLVNDQHGHIAGDQILVAIGVLINSQLREVDITGRYGGDEFVVLLPETSLDNALLVGERIRAAVAQQGILTDCGRIPVTVSIGVSEMRPKAADVSAELAALLDRADRGLYQAKHSGRNATRVVDL